MNPWEQKVALVLAAITAELEAKRLGAQDAETALARIRALMATLVPVLTSLETDPPSGGALPSPDGA